MTHEQVFKIVSDYYELKDKVERIALDTYSEVRELELFFDEFWITETGTVFCRFLYDDDVASRNVTFPVELLEDFDIEPEQRYLRSVKRVIKRIKDTLEI